MCADGDISKELFREKKSKIEDQILRLEEANTKCRQQLVDNEKEKLVTDRMESLTEFIKLKAFADKKTIPETVIDRYVSGIRYNKGVFTWVLDPRMGKEMSELTVDMNGVKKNRLNLMYHDDCSTGCNR